MHEKLVAPRHLDPVSGTHVAGMSEQHLWRQDTLGEHAAGPVQVREDGIKQARSLHQAGLQHFPIGRGNHQRQRVQAPRPRFQIMVAGQRVPVCIDCGVGDAVVVDQAVHHRAQPVQPRLATFGDRVGELGPGRSHVAVVVDEFVIAGSRAVPQVEQCFLGTRGAVSGQQAVDVVAVGSGRS
ncbi:Uncharacterised protein [Mycobacterium tuberculosis]|nr:Uncharacterised protein [Mycobacterium tuberculosis]CNV29755.1 Uncharacterised protein [Mycobacterium tuberculosis]CNV32047.1 Uncharacterised protein [Mycobacterium tuberculosis]CNV37675.1 Uncharacterised protein [Mycobacterium tuberculosis]CNZ44070.1 Uncharacterised protein [Mycobacterium tuberculosis]